ncbi:MAG: 5-formyltetrahydrofolate cyclo-ligase [Lachnospira sp.]|nr:5-formyltetrahydrofolate cyclo-ligase [Lachnospira sp.]
MTKSEARALVKARKSLMSKEEVLAKSRNIVNRLMELKEFCNEKKVLVYVSYNEEVDTWELIERCLSLGKEVYVPKVYGETIKFHKINSFSLLKAGKYGIMEPSNEFRSEWDNLSGVMIMPGLAFGRDFSRVGYGGGFYDRYLSRSLGALKNKLTTIAVCFDFQIMDSVDVEDYDYRPDIIVSESEVLRRTI